jgi:hypothetical protein
VGVLSGRRRTGWWVLACPLVALAFGASGCGSDDNSSSTASSAKTTQGDYLAVVQATGGTLAKRGNGLELALTGVAPQVLAFTDRPERKAGAVKSATFFDTWTREYGGDPPNAALALLNGNPQADTMILTLDKPRSDGSSVHFRARPVSSIRANLQQFEKQSDPSIPTRFSDASLFVDAGGLMQLVAFGSQDVYFSG